MTKTWRSPEELTSWEEVYKEGFREGFMQGMLEEARAIAARMREDGWSAEQIGNLFCSRCKAAAARPPI